MPYKAVKYHKKDNVIVVCIDSLPGERVKFAQMSDELLGLFREIAWDDGTRAIILTGTGKKSFSNEINSSKPFSRTSDVTWTDFLSFSEPVSRIDKPIIAAINGDAIGQGLELLLACDIRVVTEISRFGLNQIKAGLIPWDGGTQRLSRLVGRCKALEMILTGELIDAQEAYRIGLVNKIVSPDDLMTVAMDIAREIASKGPIALRYAKEAVYKGMDMTLEQGLRLEADLYLLIHTTRDRTEGIKAFQEKRTPKFEGK